MSIKANLIIDGNYLLYKNLFILKKLKSLSDLESLLEKDYNNLTHRYPFDNIYFVSDSKEYNWRKMIYKEYKANRKKDTEIDWEWVYSVYENFKETLRKKRNLKILELSGLEGDDFIAHIIHKSNKENFSNIIVASDGDLKQLLKIDLNNLYINIQWNYRFSDERLYLPENYQLFLEKLTNLDSNDLFSLSNNSEFLNFIENLIEKTKIKTINNEQLLFEKIIHGDSGDNIPSVIKTKNGEYNENGRGIGEKGATTVYNLYKEVNPEKIDLKSDIFINKLVDIILYYKKIKNVNEELIEKIKNNVKFNRKLIFLNSEYMPSEIYESMNEHFNYINSKQIDFDKNENEIVKEDEIVKDIDDSFNQNNDGEKFNKDKYWEI